MSLTVTLCVKCNAAPIYRVMRCRRCYKIHRMNKFHCTFRSCCRPVFAATLCQYHYRHWRVRCLLCDEHVYCKSLCRKHYRKCSARKKFPKERLCLKCQKIEYVDRLCMEHFKEKYDQKCIVVNCDRSSHKRGLCCAHYFRERRRLLKLENL